MPIVSGCEFVWNFVCFGPIFLFGMLEACWKHSKHKIVKRHLLYPYVELISNVKMKGVFHSIPFFRYYCCISFAHTFCILLYRVHGTPYVSYIHAMASENTQHVFTYQKCSNTMANIVLNLKYKWGNHLAAFAHHRQLSYIDAVILFVRIHSRYILYCHVQRAISCVAVPFPFFTIELVVVLNTVQNMLCLYLLPYLLPSHISECFLALLYIYTYIFTSNSPAPICVCVCVCAARENRSQRKGRSYIINSG